MSSQLKQNFALLFKKPHTVKFKLGSALPNPVSFHISLHSSLVEETHGHILRCRRGFLVLSASLNSARERNGK